MKPCEFIMHVTGTGSTSGRPAYHVECTTCSAVLHKGTTGPQFRINEHLRDRYSNDPAKVTLQLSPEQLTTVGEALGAKLYEDAPEHLRNNGFALEPGVDGDIDEEDEEQTAYAETYKNVKAIEAVITAAKATKGPF
jgi:hypothetical protein